MLVCDTVMLLPDISITDDESVAVIAKISCPVGFIPAASKLNRNVVSPPDKLPSVVVVILVIDMT